MACDVREVCKRETVKDGAEVCGVVSELKK